MFRNYLTIIFRNLWKNKLYSIVNIVSLGVGIASIVWGIQNYRYSFSFNNFQHDQNKIFRVLTKLSGSDNRKGVAPAALATAAKTDFSVVENTVRLDSRWLNIKSDQSEPFEADTHFTDPSFFEFFNFPLVRGTIQLEDRSTVLLTEKAARKFFGDTDPIGKTLLFYSDETYKKPLRVTGVLKDPPLNSSIRFEILTHSDNQYKQDGTPIKNDDWSWFSNAVFIKLTNPGDARGLSDRFKKYVPLEQAARHDFKLTSFMLQPFSEVGDDVDVDANALYPRPTDAAAYGPFVLALLVFLSACLNFANTSVSQSNRRLKEMGVRKVMGSSYGQIVFQQLLECAAVVMMAVLLSLIINNFWLPTYNSMFENIRIEANYLSDPILLAVMAGIFIITTLLAGAYPAFYICRFNASNIFRGSIKFGGSNLFSRLLLGLQVVISFITVVAGVAFARNASFQSHYDYGYDKANLIGVYMQNEKSYAAFRDALNKIPGIEQTAGTVNNIGYFYYRTPLEAKGVKTESMFLETGEHYVELMKLKLVAGRNFNSTGRGDLEKSLLINENLAFQFGWKPAEAIGKQIKRNDTLTCTVIGVLKDFTQNTLFDPIQPVAMSLTPAEKYTRIIIRAKPGSLTNVFAETKKTWAGLFPLKPFRSYYQDAITSEVTRVNESVALIFGWFAFISVIMAATSIYALVSLNVLKRSKEIAIRKVVGAGDVAIFRLVLKGYLWIFILSALIGCYGGYMLSKLMMDLIFRINAGVTISSLLFSFGGVLLICSITIGARVWFVLQSKATDALKAN